MQDDTSPFSMEPTAGAGLSGQCSSCDESSARCWCLDCNEALCDVCVSAHRRVTVTRSHRILNQPPAGFISTSPTKFCKLHPTEPLKLFCFTCSQLTCRDCQLMAHMNHRYQFVSEALASVKKELEVLVQPIRAHGERVRQSLLDMEIRLQDIADSECQLKTALQRSFNVLFHILKKRMDDLFKEAKTLCASECEKIQMRMTKLKHLQQSQQSVTEAADEAQKSGELSALLSCRAQIESQLQELVDQDFSPPATMSQLRIVTDRTNLTAFLNFGHLEVSWIPFSVTGTSDQDRDTPATSSSFSSSFTSSTSSSSSSLHTSTCLTLPQTWTTCDTISPVSVNFPQDSSQSFSNQPSALVTTASSVSVLQSVRPSPGSAVSHLGTNPAQVLLQKTLVQPAPSVPKLQPTSVTFRPSDGPSLPCTLLSLNQPLLVSNQVPSPYQNQTAVVLTTKPQFVYQVSSLPQFPMMLSQIESTTLSGKNCPTQKNCGSLHMLPGASTSSETTPPTSTCPSSSNRPLPPTGKTNDCGSGGQMKCYSTSESSLSSQLCPPPSSFPLTASSSSSVAPNTCGNPPLSTTTCGNDTPVPANCPSDSSKSLSIQFSNIQPKAPMIQTVKPDHRPKEDKGRAAEAAEAAERLVPHVNPGSSTLKLQQQSPVVRAVADSACDAQKVTVRWQETEDEPTSTMSEETQPAGSPAEPEQSDEVAEEASTVIGHPDFSLSQWQPRVCLFRLPVSPLRQACPHSGFSLDPGAAEDEMNEDTQSVGDDITDDVTEPPSSPESLVTLQLVTCSACGSAYGSIICSACGRGYHRDCHVPPIGPDMWSEWICSLCQDLTDPSDPYSSERPQRAQSPCLSLLDQRRCESLLLELMVEGCSCLSEFPSVRSHLKSLSERLTGGCASYQTAAEFLSDIWTPLTDASQDNDLLNKLQETFQSRLMETFGSKLHPSVLMPPSRRTREGGKLTSEEQEVMTSEEQEVMTSEEQEVFPSQSKLSQLRKRLRDFLGQVETHRSKRTKTN